MAIDYEGWKVAGWLPEDSADGVRIERFTITEDDSKFDRLRAAFNGHGRYGRPGTYTQLTIDGELMMTDTHDEVHDHLPPVYAAERRLATRAVINGLGIGMVAMQIALVPTMQRIDIVEKDDRVIGMVKDNLLAGIRARRTDPPLIAVHHGDALDHQWRRGMKWDIAWHDIWPSFNADNVPQMTRLRMRYARRAAWQGCWGEKETRRHAGMRVYR